MKRYLLLLLIIPILLSGCSKTEDKDVSTSSSTTKSTESSTTDSSKSTTTSTSNSTKEKNYNLTLYVYDYCTGVDEIYKYKTYKIPASKSVSSYFKENNVKVFSYNPFANKKKALYYDKKAIDKHIKDIKEHTKCMSDCKDKECRKKCPYYEKYGDSLTSYYKYEDEAKKYDVTKKIDKDISLVVTNPCAA